MKPETKSSAYWRGVFFGAATVSALRIFHQDYYGKDGYIEQVVKHWIYMPAWVGGIASVAIIIFLLVEAHRLKKIDELEGPRLIRSRLAELEISNRVAELEKKIIELEHVAYNTKTMS